MPSRFRVLALIEGGISHGMGFSIDRAAAHFCLCDRSDHLHLLEDREPWEKMVIFQ
jgi:hypothetical protein